MYPSHVVEMFTVCILIIIYLKTGFFRTVIARVQLQSVYFF